MLLCCWLLCCWLLCGVVEGEKSILFSPSFFVFVFVLVFCFLIIHHVVGIVRPRH